MAKRPVVDVKIRSKRQDDGSTLLRMLITHPMETGRRKDEADGKVVPAHYLEEVTVLHNNEIVARCLTGPGVSRDPYFAFKLRDCKPGDSLRVEWRDNKGGSGNATAVSE
ncbi:thiosulfate oxidation carrier complex protein SoxZ [Methylogaea oryzae]|uniref:Thiosulfate oxidation carrier complex protein SoxZ n=1 Tax=Methylogaea oryzae TaxID=1295382 RepID=A0A8D4VL95_9GAMM|nr:thiosulfate oxidation carrier complex protein SoxZ [Methylogaea oryzae]BBL69651.1 thiosulfate oxidation carrier complex protein SoxZ [Methylogaea oryzae]